MNHDGEHFQALVIALLLLNAIAFVAILLRLQTLIEAHHGLLGG